MKAVDRSDWNFCRVRVDEDGAVEWLKNNRSTDVGDTPLWVLISLGMIALKEDKDESNN